MRPTPTRVAAAAVLAAGLGLGLASPAQAATSYTLNLKGVDFNGATATYGVTLINVKTGAKIQRSTGFKVKLKAGTYAAFTEKWLGNERVLGGQSVVLDKNREITFDARKSKKVGFVVTDDPDAETPYASVQATLFYKGSPALPAPEIPNDADAPYVIPTTSKYVSLVAFGALQQKTANPAVRPGYHYSLTNVTKQGVPADPVKRVKRADLARVHVTVRSLDPGKMSGVWASPTGAHEKAGWLGSNGSTTSAPTSFVSYRSPGVSWKNHAYLNYGSSSDTGSAQITNSVSPVYKAGGKYTETWGAGVWGPTPRGVSAGLKGRTLALRTPSMICPPPRTAAEKCSLSKVAKTSRLYKGRTLVKQGTGDLSVKLPTSAAWYSLTTDAKRPAGSLLSTRVTSTWKFKARGYNDTRAHAAPALPVVVYRPRGLDDTNHAKLGTVTDVPVSVHAKGTELSSVKSLAVEASTDGGKTWKKLTVKREGKHWLVRVANAGTVSLRASVTTRTGESATQTVLSAYGVR